MVFLSLRKSDARETSLTFFVYFFTLIAAQLSISAFAFPKKFHLIPVLLFSAKYSAQMGGGISKDGGQMHYRLHNIYLNAVKTYGR